MLTTGSCGDPPGEPAADLGNALMSRYVGFAGWLRSNGFNVTSSDMSIVMSVAQRFGQLDRVLLKSGLRAVLCSRAEEWRRFDMLFDAYFLRPNRQRLVETRAGGAGALSMEREGGARDASEGMPVASAGAAGGDAEAEGGTAEHGMSRAESLQHVDFRHLDQPDALYAIDQAIRHFVERLRGMKVRRERRAASGHAIDMAQTLRRSVSHGGVPLELAWRSRRRVRPRIVMLLDVSRSMNLYSFFFMRLARVISARLSDVHCFAFHTRLVGIGPAMRDPDPRRSQERLEMLSMGWGGGTRIGDSLETFNREHGTALLHSRTAVVIISDGYDAGDATCLQAALRRLKRRCRSLIWLNPLAGRPDYSPSSTSMSAALPLIDLFAGVADLDSLERVFPRVLAVLQ